LKVNRPDVVVLGPVDTLGLGVGVVGVEAAGAAGDDGELEPQATQASRHNATGARRYEWAAMDGQSIYSTPPSAQAAASVFRGECIKPPRRV
jgi:hypothetical protein